MRESSISSDKKKYNYLYFFFAFLLIFVLLLFWTRIHYRKKSPTEIHPQYNGMSTHNLGQMHTVTVDWPQPVCPSRAASNIKFKQLANECHRYSGLHMLGCSLICMSARQFVIMCIKIWVSAWQYMQGVLMELLNDPFVIGSQCKVMPTKKTLRCT